MKLFFDVVFPHSMFCIFFPDKIQFYKYYESKVDMFLIFNFLGFIPFKVC